MKRRTDPFGLIGATAAGKCVGYDLAMLAVLHVQRQINRLERWLTSSGDRWGL